MKHLQNKVAESRLALPLTAVVATVVWLLAGLLKGELVTQFVCFAITTYLIVELNNINALIRIYSRLVSCSFILLSCATCFTFHSESGEIVELCAVASYITLFHTYQDRQSPGWTYYAFLCVGLASMVYVHILYYVPILWLLMLSRLGSISWRTFFASLLGIITPYWFASLYFLYTKEFTVAGEHFAELGRFGTLADFSVLNISQVLSLALVFVLAVTGTVHYIRTSFNDKIRIRMFYGCFIISDIITMTFLVLQPQHFDLLIRIMTINTSPLIAHFLALTKTKVTNWAFCAITVATLALIAFNLWMLL